MLPGCQTSCEPAPPTSPADDTDEVTRNCDEAGFITREDQFLSGWYPENITRDLMLWTDEHGGSWVVVSSSDTEKYIDNDDITDHVLFKRVKDLPPADGEPFFPSDAELRISTDPPSYWWGSDLARYRSEGLPDALVVSCGGYPAGDEGEGRLFLYSDPLARAGADQQALMSWTEADAWIEASGTQVRFARTYTTGPATTESERSLLVLEYRTADSTEAPWEIAVFDDLEPGQSTSGDAKLILQSETYYSGGGDDTFAVVGDLDGDGLSELAFGEPWESTPTGSGQFHVVPGGLQGTLALDDVGALVQPEHGGFAAKIILGELDIDGDGLHDLAVSSPYTGYADAHDTLSWCGAVFLYSGADLSRGETGAHATVMGHLAYEELGHLGLVRCGSNHVGINGGAHEYCDTVNNGIVYVVPSDLEGTHWVDEVAQLALTGDEPGRKVVPGLEYDEVHGQLVLGAASVPNGEYDSTGMVYLLDIDL